jgi:hypothetical protein
MLGGVMELDASETRLFRELEERLLQPSVRASAVQVAMLLDDDFIEFGSSGRVYDKEQIIKLLQDEEGRGRPTLRDFSARRLAPDVVLVTYRVVETRTIRSSIWKSTLGQWRMLFHQGTRSEIE